MQRYLPCSGVNSLPVGLGETLGTGQPLAPWTLLLQETQHRAGQDPAGS